MSEKISALVDNELSEFERARVIKDLGARSDLASVWSNYHLIGCVIRQEPILPLIELPDRVAEKLDQESAPSISRFSMKGGLAIAASVCAVLITGWLIFSPGNQIQPQGQVSSSSANELAFSDYGTRWEGADPQLEDTLNAFLVEHGEFTGASSMNGLVAYAKFVAYDSR